MYHANEDGDGRRDHSEEGFAEVVRAVAVLDRVDGGDEQHDRRAEETARRRAEVRAVDLAVDSGALRPVKKTHTRGLTRYSRHHRLKSITLEETARRRAEVRAVDLAVDSGALRPVKKTHTRGLTRYSRHNRLKSTTLEETARRRAEVRAVDLAVDSGALRPVEKTHVR